MVVIQRVEEVTACCKVFLSKSQELQVKSDPGVKIRSECFQNFKVFIVKSFCRKFCPICHYSVYYINVCIERPVKI